MIDLSLIVSVSLIHLLAVMSPGPDFFMALKNSITYSRKTGIYTAIGFGLGIAVHIFYSLAGLALIISQSIIIFNTIKYIGVLYLIYIGIQSFRSKRNAITIEENAPKEDIASYQAIRMGFLTNVLNPKATLFFLSLFTLVVSPDTHTTTLIIISLIMIFDTMLWFSLVAIFITHTRVRQAYSRYQKAIEKVFGGILIFIGLKIALSK